MSDARIVDRIEEVAGRANWVRVVFADGDAMEVPLGAWVDAGARVGGALHPSVEVVLARAAAVERAKDAARAYLRARPRTRAQVLAHLARRRVDEAVAREAVEALEEAGVLDDAAYAQLYTETQGQRMSRRELTWRLRRSGVARADVDAALADGPEGRARERAAALRVARAYMRKHASKPEGLRERLGAHLQRKGFPVPLILEILREFDLGGDEPFS
ncbi:regulatory protein RecX [Alicyclobacillus sp.]|uniref:regulatory protein RecX n=1 Tax=Alicyclobacillus sp. TaxID=61169 RepID=UPI0025B89B5F|nr:regulatory protein RecX [Alicyclobacillus sp.]MCL6516236.1 recombination regulator RecX [Alicyclobacillus sp.]